MFEHNGREYRLKFNLERINLVESALNKPLLSIYTEHQGVFTLSEMEKIFMVCLKENGSDYFVSNSNAKKIFEEMIQEENGYRKISDEIGKTLYEDCPFLFPTVS